MRRVDLDLKRRGVGGGTLAVDNVHCFHSIEGQKRGVLVNVETSK